jgi:hypothetical protein
MPRTRGARDIAAVLDLRRSCRSSERGAMGQQSHTVRQSRSRRATQSQRDPIQCFGRAPCPSRIPQDRVGQPFREDAPSAIPPAAEELPSLQVNTDRDALPGEVAQFPRVPAVHAPRDRLTLRAGRRRTAGTQVHLDRPVLRTQQTEFHFSSIR